MCFARKVFVCFLYFLKELVGKTWWRRVFLVRRYLILDSFFFFNVKIGFSSCVYLDKAFCFLGICPDHPNFPSDKCQVVPFYLQQLLWYFLLKILGIANLHFVSFSENQLWALWSLVFIFYCINFYSLFLLLALHVFAVLFSSF